LLSKLFEEICLEDSSSGSSDATHHCSKTKSSSVTRVSDVSIASHSDLRHCIVLRELSVCHTAADSYHSNYNAWNHRIWVMDNFTCCRMQVCVDVLFKIYNFSAPIILLILVPFKISNLTSNLAVKLKLHNSKF